VQDLTDLHEFSVRQFRLFWRLLLEWADLPVDGSLERFCTDDDIEAARFFPDLRLNYAEVVLAGRDDAPAVTAYRDNAPAERLMRSELREYVSRVAGALQALGVGEGDRVVAVARNDASTIVACLATAALGASFAIVDAEMSEEAILRRFSQLSPRVLFAHAREGKVAAVASSLPSLRAVITGGEALAAPAMTQWPRLPFDHPLFVSFSADASVIVHSAGGTLLEHVKEHRLHCDLGEEDRLFVQTSCAEMMWKWQLSALASGCEIILHDGPTEAQTLWRITAEHRVTHFVTTPGYLKWCEDRGYAPGRALDLSALRAVMSVGSSLRDRHYDWFARAVGRVPLEVMAGSDEILGCYALGSPDQPVCRGEAQSISLGLDLRVMPLAGETRPGIGQLVCATPIPSQPPGTRIEGDVIEITGRGSVRLYGHADSVIDIRGVSVIPADIYAALDGFPELAQMLAVAQRDERAPDGVRLVLMVTTRPGLAFTDEVTTDIRRVIGAKLTPVHVPAVIAEVAELPVTYGGELSEAAARAALNGEPASDRDALRNPACLEELARHPLLRRKREVRAGHVPQPGDAPIEARLTAIWEEVFGIVPLGPDADFFRLGGDSLTALSLMAAIEEATGQRLPTSVLMERHTVAALAELLREEAGVASGSVVRVRPGEGRPVFLVPGLSGTPLEAHQLLRRLDIARPIYVLPSRGFDGVGYRNRWRGWRISLPRTSRRCGKYRRTDRTPSSGSRSAD
jgi:acetoacetyl-CoA synthetase